MDIFGEILGDLFSWVFTEVLCILGLITAIGSLIVRLAVWPLDRLVIWVWKRLGRSVSDTDRGTVRSRVLIAMVVIWTAFLARWAWSARRTGHLWVIPLVIFVLSLAAAVSTWRTWQEQRGN